MHSRCLVTSRQRAGREHSEPCLALQVLQIIRGQEDVEEEFQDIVDQTREANAIHHPLRALLRPCYRPQLVISSVIAVVQQLTGINAIMCAPCFAKVLLPWS